MKKLKKILSVVLVVVMLCAVTVSVSVTSKADDEIAYSFSQSKWDWWGCAQGTVNGQWGQNNNALTRYFLDGSVTYDVVGISDTLTAFQQVQDKWQASLPEGNLYFYFTNNTSCSLEVKIVTSANLTLVDKWVAAGATQKLEFTNESATAFSIFAMNWNTTVPGGIELFTFSPIYYQPSVEETTVPEEPSDKNVIYKFTSGNMGLGKTEGCNPNTGWSWGTFATTSFVYNSDGSAVVSVAENTYDKFRQFNSNWNNIPATSDTAYIDITNNSNRDVKIKIITSGYTTPSDSELPVVKVGNTYTMEIGALQGGKMTIQLLDNAGSDSITCQDDIFTISGIYTLPVQYEVTLDGESVGSFNSGDIYTLPESANNSFVGYSDGQKLYKAGDSISVEEDIALKSLDLGLSMESGASIRYSNPTGIRFYTKLDKDVLAELENLGASVQIGTLISRVDLLGTDNLDLDLAEGKFVNVLYNSRAWFQEDSFSGFVGSIVTIKTQNLNRDFIGRGYATVTLGDFNNAVYADYYDNNSSNNARSICFIAKQIQDSSVYQELSAEKKKIVDDYAVNYIA